MWIIVAGVIDQVSGFWLEILAVSFNFPREITLLNWQEVRENVNNNDSTQVLNSINLINQVSKRFVIFH